MAMTINLRKMVHLKSPDYMNPNPAGNTIAGAFVIADTNSFLPSNDGVFYMGGASVCWGYHADEDAWGQVPNSGIAGTFGAGACGVLRAYGAPGGVGSSTATAGTTTTLTTALTLVRGLEGHYVRVIGGTGIGYQGMITKNTMGANSVLTVSPANGVAFDATTVFQMMTGSVWVFNPGAGAVGFSVYDRATNAWTAKAVTGLPTTFASDGKLINTTGVASNDGAGFVTGTATAGGATTITLEAGKVFVTNQWTNSQIRIVSGTGAGQIRTISTNSAGASPVLTVSSAWATNPDATSTYVIEGNDDYIYLMGNLSVTLYRYSISGNTWTTLAPGAARAAAVGAGVMATWVDNISESSWTDGSYGTHYTGLIRQNGRYIYSLRGGGSSALDVYDIAANTWISGVAYGGQMEGFSTGSCAVDTGKFIYIQKDATGRIYRFDISRHVIEPFAVNPIPQGAAVIGDKMFIQTYKDGATSLQYLYTLGNTRAELTRWLIV